jgi:hypothetical protein
MRIPVSKITAEAARNGLLMTIKSVHGTEYEALLSPDQTKAFAELIEAVRAGSPPQMRLSCEGPWVGKPRASRGGHGPLPNVHGRTKR